MIDLKVYRITFSIFNHLTYSLVDRHNYRNGHEVPKTKLKTNMRYENEKRT